MTTTTMSNTLYTTAHFTPDHAKIVGDESKVEEYHRLAAKYTTTLQPKTVDIASTSLEGEMKAGLLMEQEGDRMILVSGVMHETADGTMEKTEEFQKLVRCIRSIVTAKKGKYYIHILGPHVTTYPHPKLLEKLEDGTYTLEGGFWAPGHAMPEETIIAEVEEDGKEAVLTTCLMCSVLSNFNVIKKEETTPRSIGCSLDKVPNAAMDVAILSAEHSIQLAKAVAAIAYPELYMNTDANDDTITRTMNGIEKVRTKKDAGDEAVTSLKRKLIEDRPATVTGLCTDIYTMLCKTSAFDVQKKLGQLPILTGKWFDVVKGTPIHKYRDFDAEDLRKLGANSIMQASVIMLRIHAGDKDLYGRLVFDLETGNVPVESAMHDPVKADKATLAPGGSKYLFSGRFPDRVWGAFCGCPRYTLKPDGLVHKDGQAQVGHLGNGAELVRQAIRGDVHVLEFFGIQEKLTLESMGSGAAKAIDLFWEMVKS